MNKEYAIEQAELFLKKIKHLRLLEEKTQVGLSTESGIPQKTISRLESGKSVPSLQTLIHLIDTLGYKVEFKLDKKGEELNE